MTDRTPTTGTICQCGLAKSYHAARWNQDHKYAPRYPDRTPTTAAGRAFVALYEPKDRGVQAEWVLAIEAETRASLEAEIERLRAAALALLNWYDGPPFVYEESDMETRLNALRAALEEPTP